MTAMTAMSACVVVRVVKAEGSTPREVGAVMLVTQDGFKGSIGGGTLEWQAMAEAQAMLSEAKTTKQMHKHLGPDMGQCCGGRVTLFFESFATVAESDFEQAPDLTHIHLWGAGHVGRALVMALAPLPFRVSWWDQRPNAFPQMVPQNVTCRNGSPADMTPDAMVLVMSHSHALDFEIVDFALRNPEFRFVGLIGSQTKKARFLKRLREASVDASRLTCPIGVGTVKSKHPAAIAASVAVQMLAQDELLRSQNLPSKTALDWIKQAQ
jgi:xanthine dehydrogenase accessory factor